MNQVNTIGRLGARGSPEHDHVPEDDGKDVYWFSALCWNGPAETVAACLHKGRRMAGRHTISDLKEEGWGKTETLTLSGPLFHIHPSSL